MQTLYILFYVTKSYLLSSMICQTVYCLPELIWTYNTSAFATRPIYCMYAVLQNMQKQIPMTDWWWRWLQLVCCSISIG